MSNEISLLVILWVIYLFELFVWKPRDGVLFKLSGESKPILPKALFGNRNGSIIVNNIIPYSQLCALVRSPRLTIGGNSISNQPIQNLSNDIGLFYDFKTLSIDEIDNIERDGNRIIINGIFFVDCSFSKSTAKHIKVIRDLRESKLACRAKVIEEYYGSQFPSCEIIKHKAAVLLKETSKLRLSSTILFILSFIVFPISYYFYPSSYLLLICLILSLILGWINTAFFYFAHKRLLPEESSLRLKCLLKQISCFPISAAASKDISLHYFGDINPLLLSKVALRDGNFEIFSRMAWLDIIYPKSSISCGNFSSTHLSFQHLIFEFLQRSGICPTSLEQPSHGFDESTICYCPRCLAEFTLRRMFCSECRVVETKTLES